MRHSHPAVKPSIDSVRVSGAAAPALAPAKEPSNWRQRFFDEDGNPLPADGVRIDVTTGEKLGKVKG